MRWVKNAEEILGSLACRTQGGGYYQRTIGVEVLEGVSWKDRRGRKIRQVVGRFLINGNNP